MKPGAKTTQTWAYFPHEADVGVVGYGKDAAEAFENAARAMIAVLVPLDQIRRAEVVEVICSAPDPEILLLDWLNAVIFEMATRRMIFGDFRVSIEGNRLSGQMWGEPTDPARHEPSVEPKGATLTELCVTEEPDGRWRAQCVVDV